MFEIRFTSHSFKQLEKIVRKSEAVNKIMKEKFAALQKLNIEICLKNQQVKIVKGVSKNIEKQLAKEGFDPLIYEYRNFPKRYPFRIYFIKKGKQLIILEILHHQNIKSKLVNQLANIISKVHKEK